jgi:hypothetical protein
MQKALLLVREAGAAIRLRDSASIEISGDYMRLQ